MEGMFFCIACQHFSLLQTSSNCDPARATRSKVARLNRAVECKTNLIVLKTCALSSAKGSFHDFPQIRHRIIDCICSLLMIDLMPRFMNMCGELKSRVVETGASAS